MSDGASLGTARGTITIDSTQALGSLNSLGGALDNFNSRTQGLTGTTNSFAQSTVGLAQGMQNVGNAMERAGAAVAEPFVDAAKSALDFESEMANTNAVMDVTGSQFSDLSDLALQLGKDTIFTANQTAQGITELGRAGISFEDIMSGAAAAATDLAGAGGVEVPKAAAVMSAAMAAFNISGEDSVRIADALAGAANLSLTDINQLGLGLGQVGGIADAANMSMEDTVSFLALMADNGIRGSDAATSMKSALLRLLSPTDTAAAKMDELGVQLFDTEGNFIGLQGASQEFFDAWKSSGQTMSEFLKPLGDVFGTDAVRAILFGMQAIEADQTGIGKGWKDYEAATHDAGAAHDFMVAKMDTTAGSIEKLNGSLDVLRVKMGTPLIEGIRAPIDALTEFVNVLTNIPAPILGAIGIVGTLAAAILTLGGAFLVVGGYVLEAVARFQALGIGMDVIFGAATKLTLGLTGIGLAITAVALAFNTNFLGFRDAIQAVIDKIDELTQKFKFFFNANKQSQDSSGGMFSSDLAKNISAFGRALDTVLGTDLSGFFDTLASGADTLDMMGKRFNDAAFFMNRYTKDSKNLTTQGKAIDALGHTIDSIFGTDVSGAFSAAADGVDGFINAFQSLTGDSGWQTFPALVESLGIGIEDVFGPNGVSQNLENFAFLAKDVQTAWETSVQNGLSPAAAALRAMSVAAAGAGFDGLSDALENAANSSIRFGDSFAAASDKLAGQGVVGLPNTILALNDALIATLGIGFPDFVLQAASAMAAFQTAMSNGLNEGLNPFQAALKGVGAAIGSVFGPEARANFFSFVDAMGQLGGAVQGAVAAGLGRVGQMFSEIGTALSTGDIQGALTAVQSLIQDVGTALQAAGQQALDWVINVGEPALAGWAAEQAGRFTEWLKEKIGIVGDAAGQTLATIQNWFIEVGIPQATGWLQQTGADVISWIQEQLDRLIPAAGETLGKVTGWFIEVGIPEIKEAAGGAGGIKDAVIKWVSDQITFPSVGELPGIKEKVQAFGNDLGASIAGFLADAMEVVRGILGVGGAGGAGGGPTGPGGLGGGPAGALGGDMEASAGQLAATVVEGFLRGFGSGFAEAVGQANLAEFISTGNFEPLKQQLITTVTDALATIPDALKATVDNTIKELQTVMATLFNIGDWLSESVATGPVGLGGGPGGGLSRGAAAIQVPIENAFNAMVEAVKKAAAGLKDKIGAALPDNPFTGLTEKLQGFADGAATAIAAASKTVTDALSQLTIDISSGGAGGGGGTLDSATIGAGADLGETVMGDLGTGAEQGAQAAAPSFQDQFGSAISTIIGFAVPASLIGFGDTVSGDIGAAVPASDGVAAAQAGFSPFIDGVSGETTNQITTMGSEVQSAAAASAPAAMDGIGPVIDSALSTAVQGITLEALAQAIGQKIGDAVVAGIASASGGEAQAGLSAGTGGAANIGSQIANALASSIQGADFSLVGTAIQTKISEALSAGFSSAEATGPSTAGIDIGSQIALSLSSAIQGSDFTVVSQAIQQKISESLSGGTGGTTQTTDVSGAAGEGATIGASIAASLANAILGSDFSVVGQAISQKISESVSTATAGGGATGPVGLGGGPGGGGGGGIAAGVVASIVSEFQGANYAPIGQAVGQGIADAIGTGLVQIGTQVGTGIDAIITSASTAAEGANEAGVIFTEALAGGISSTSGTIDIAASTAMTTAVTSATTVASTAQPVGTAFTTAVGAGIGAGTGTVTSAVDAMVQAAISGGSAAAAGANAIGTAFTGAVGSGIGAGTGTITSAVAAMVGAAIDAGVGAAAGASAIGAAISSGAAAGVIVSALVGPVTEMVNAGIAAGLAAADAGSPSKKMMEQGKGLAEGAAIGVQKNDEKLAKSVDRMINKVIKSVIRMNPELLQALSLGNEFSNLPGLEQFGSQITSIAGNISGTINSVHDSFTDLSKTIGKGLRDTKDKSKKESRGLGSDAADAFNQMIKDRKALFKSSKKDVKGGLFDLQALGSDVFELQQISKQLERVDGPNTFAEDVAALADSLENDRRSAINAGVDLFNSLDVQLEKAKKRHRRRGREIGDETGVGITEGFADSTGTAVKDVTSLTDAIINTFNANLSRLPEMATAIGKAIPESIGTGVESGLKPLSTSVGTVGGAVTDGLDTAAPDIQNAAETAANDFGFDITRGIEGLVTPVSSASQALGKDIGVGFDGGMATNKPATTVGTFGTAIKTAIDGLIQSVGQGGERIGTSFTSGVAQGGDPVGAGKSLTTGAQTGITSGLPNTVNTADKAGESVGTSYTDAISDACNPLNDQAQSLTDTCVPDGITSGLPSATGAAQTAGQKISDSLSGGLELRKKTVTNAFDAAGKGFGQTLAGAITSKQTENRNAVNTLTTTIGAIDAAPKGKSVGTSFGAGIVSGINGSKADVEEAARKLVDAAKNAADEEADSKSPSKLFMETGMNMALGVQLGLESGQAGIMNAAQDSVQELAALFAGTGMDNATNAIHASLGGYTDEVKDALNDLERTTKNLDLSGIILPDDRALAAAMRTTGRSASGASVDNSIRIGNIVVQKGSPLEKALFDAVDHLQATSGQYSVQ